ncbi:hypothetical protein CIL03_01555 [Virgibacillus indicus]|uniref:Lipopolysaccharide assembly protein A domain-containing protein n=1 Tax=Virgibacillus indicus TaxID=2024554 RepID=A0A265NCT0_9BACI|nr:lipopolysaccharide assembly protein LapA domain-containing protein [Virgibacillus indicus]OZU89852.1 hypothetical protein CIL03_01555 [Virgibacillus indicus]
MKAQTYVILAILFVIIVAVFAVTNVEPVEVNYLFWSGKSPLILIILFSVLMGGIITAASGMVKMYKMQKELKMYKNENNEMRKILKKNGLKLKENLSDTRNKKVTAGTSNKKKK